MRDTQHYLLSELLRILTIINTAGSGIRPAHLAVSTITGWQRWETLLSQLEGQDKLEKVHCMPYFIDITTRDRVN